MNIATFSPSMALIYVYLLLWLLMDVRFRALTAVQKWAVPVLFVLQAAANDVLRLQLGAAVYGKLIFLTLHLPVFLIFLWITRCGTLKMVFMILTAVVFTSPVVLVGNMVRRTLFVGSKSALLLTNLLVYAIMLLLAQFVFRKGFNYLLKYGERKFFLQFLLVPLVYYVYVYASINVDVSRLQSAAGVIMRFLPTVQVFLLYFLLPMNYREFSEKQELNTMQSILLQELDAAEEQILHLHEVQSQTAIYRHDMRHHLTAIDGFLAAGKVQQATDYIQKVQVDVDAITLRRFCENDLVNLLCSSFAGKAERMGIDLQIEARLPGKLSVPHTELCSMLSNGLENAMHAVLGLEPSKRWVKLYCEVNRNKLLVEIRNPYEGKIEMQDGLPVSRQEGHGYGCRSMQTIAERNRGLCSFVPENGVFTFRVILPVGIDRKS